MKIKIKQHFIPTLATIGVFILAYLVSSIRFPGFLSMTVFLNLFTDNSFLGIMAVGMTFVILSGGIDLSVGSVVGCSSIAIAVLIRDAHLHPLVAVLLMLGCGTIFGSIMGYLIHFYKIPPFMVTLAGLFFARGLGFVISENCVPINVPFYSKLMNFNIPVLDGYLTTPAIIFIMVLAVGIFLAHRTRFGRAVYAIGGNEQSAELMGLKVGTTKVAIYAFSGFCSTLAGAVYSLYTYSGNAWAANGFEMDAIAAVVIGGTLLTGGIGYVFGTLFGVLTLGVIQTYISFDGTLSSWWTRIAIGLLLFIFIALQRFFSESSSAMVQKTHVTFITNEADGISSPV